MSVPVNLAAATSHDPRPKSAVSGMTGFFGLAGLIAWTMVARAYGMEGPFAAITALLACAVPMLAWSLAVDKVHRNQTTGLDWNGPLRPFSESIDFSIAKIAGLWGIWAVIGTLYCLCRFYWEGPYLFSMQTLGVAAIPLLVLSVPYVLWIDRRLVEPRDGAWHFGQLLIGRADLVDREMLHDFFRAWAVKGFFLAFMISIVPGNWTDTVRADGEWIADSPVNLALWLISFMFLVDVTFATVGYVLTLKPLDAHIRNANPHATGWVSALICYPPFILMNPGGPLDYHPGTADWTQWLDSYPLLSALMGAWLVLLTAVYAWATVAFGFRFSNLTHRGILTHGPYALTKHPAYVSKNLFWWFAVLPFLATTGSVADAVRNTAILGLVSFVYYWRARTEERHLAADPAYREYAEWMERNGPLPRLLGRLKANGRSADPVAAE